MSEPYRPQIKSRPSPVLAIILLIIGLAIVGGIAWALVNMGAKSPTYQHALGADNVFHAGNAESLAAEIRSGGPILYPDLLRQQHGTVVLVQHIGADNTKGWYAFSARAEGSPLTCQVKWISTNSNFFDACSNKNYPADGTGLTQFKTEVVSGRVDVKLRKATN